MNTETMPDVLRGIAPEVGSIWEWEPLNSRARELVRVTAVTWNGEECWVESEPMTRNVYLNPAPGRDRFQNELSRWVQATVLVDIDEDHVRPLGSDTWPS